MSIPNFYSRRSVFMVYLIDNKGNMWREMWYEGYAIFGGKDFFELVAEMNGKKTRDEGIFIYYNQNEENAVYPNLVQNPDHWKWKNKKPKPCPHQGYFY
ncbi:MAG: hypothetical protein ACQESK_10885 [Bacteroidota bacterium]